MNNRSRLLAPTISVFLSLNFLQGLAQSAYEPYTFTTLSGVAPGSGPRAGSAARFGLPSMSMNLAVDNGGNVYVAETGNAAIRKVTPTGVVTTLAGNIQANGVAVDGAGNVYASDFWFGNVIRRVTPAGFVTVYAGDPNTIGGGDDGTGTAGKFCCANGLAVDSAGNIFVGDAGRIRKVTPAGVVTTMAGANLSFADGTGKAARFSWLQGLAVDSTDNVYVADPRNAAIRKVTPAGVVTTLAGPAQFAADGAVGGNAVGLAADNQGNVYLADSYNNTIRKVTPAGVVTTLAGLAGSFGFADGTGSDARFNYPAGLAMDSAGNIYVGDVGNNMIRKLTPAGVVTTLAGLAGSAGRTDGTGNAARFGASSGWLGPSGLAVERSGNVYVTDLGAIRKITPAGVVTTLAGLAGTEGSTDGTGSDARLGRTYATGVTVDSAGNVYATDIGTIRKITPAGVVTTLAGQPGGQGWSDGTGSEAWFSGDIRGVAVDSAGTLYVADTGNNVIRKVTPTGVVTTLAGLPDVRGSDDGTGMAARFNSPWGMAVDSAGTVYLADRWNYTIRKVTPTGVVTTLAGLAGKNGTADGTGSSARFGVPDGGFDDGYGGPWALAVDSAGNVYATDWGRIRKITPAGVVTTLAGLSNWDHVPESTDGIGSDARFSYPFGVAVDAAGALYVADSGNATVRKGYPALTITASGQQFGLDASHVGLKFPAPIGSSVVVEGSTDLRTWLPLWTNMVGGALGFSDPQSGICAKRFYRAWMK